MQVQGTGEARGCSHCRTQKARGWDPTPGTTHIISRRDSRGQRSSGWQIPTGSPSSCTGARAQVTVGMRPHTCLRAHISTRTVSGANISWSKQATGRCFGPRQLHALHTQPHAGPLARPSHSQQHTHPAPLGANARTDPFSPPRTGRCGRTRSAHVPSDSLSQPPDGLPPPRPAQRSPAVLTGARCRGGCSWARLAGPYRGNPPWCRCRRRAAGRLRRGPGTARRTPGARRRPAEPPGPPLPLRRSRPRRAAPPWQRAAKRRERCASPGARLGLARHSPVEARPHSSLPPHPAAQAQPPRWLLPPSALPAPPSPPPPVAAAPPRAPRHGSGNRRGSVPR